MALEYKELLAELVQHLLEVLRFLLQKTFAQWGISVIAGGGFLAMIYGGDYGLGLAALYVAGVWGIGAWLYSDELSTKRPTKPRSTKVVVIEKYHYKQRTYRFLQFSIPSLVVLVLAIATLFVNNKRHEKELLALHGLLYPANDPYPQNVCPIPDGAVAVIFGDSVAYTTGSKMTIIGIDSSKEDNRKEILGIERDQDDVVLNADIRTSDEKVVALISRNTFEVNRNNILDFESPRPDRSTINITDQYGHKLQIRYMNKRAFRLTGTFYLNPYQSLEITDTKVVMRPQNNVFSRNCFANVGTVFNFTQP